MNRLLRPIIIAAFSISSIGNINAQNLTNEGTDFWCAYTEMFDHASALFEINISSRTNTSGTIEIPGYFTTPFNVVAGAVTTVVIPPALANVITSEAVLDKAIHITSVDPISAFASTYHLYRSEASVLLPVPSLGSNYMASSYANTSLTHKSHFTIVCGAVPATVQITTSCDTEGAHSAGVPWTVTLNPGEIYMVQAANGLTNDVTGSRIAALNGTDKFAVFNGHTFAKIALCGNGTKDPIYDIAYPIESLGKEYTIVRTEGQTQNAYRATALDDNTQIFENGGLVATLNAGQSYDALFINNALSITGDKAFSLTQSMTNAACSINNAADPAMVVINSNEQMFLDTITFFAVAANGINQNFTNVVTRTSETALVQLNGVAVGAWTTVPNNAALSYTTVNTPAGSHTLTTSGCGFLAYAYGHQWAESYFYSAGARVNVIEDSISFTQYIGTNPNFCDVDTVEFTPYISGGTPIQYEWDFGDGTTSALPNPVHVYNTDGQFAIELVIHFQCETDTILDTIDIYHSPEFAKTSNDVTCFGYSDGDVDLTLVSGGTGVMNYVWSNGDITEDIIGLAPGQYSVQVTDAMGCFDQDTTDILEPAALQINVTVTDPLCFINGLGSATVDNIVGGVGPYNYSWTSGGNAATEIDLTGGNYTVSVSDANTCAATFDFIISPALAIDVAVSDTLICQDGAADLIALGSGGAGGPFTYAWSESGVVLGSTNVAPIVQTCYQIVVTDGANCPSLSYDLCVDVNDLLNLNITTSDICPGDLAELVSAYAGGDGNYSFDWQSQSASVGSLADLNFAQQNATQDYCLTLSDGCETPDITLCETVDLYSLPAVNIPYQSGCPPFTANFDNVVDASAIAAADWSFGNGASSAVTSPTITYDYSGLYDVSVTFTTNDGCIVTESVTNIVEVYDEVHALFEFGGNNPNITVEDTEVMFTNTSDNGYTYSWDFGDEQSSSIENPTHIYPDLGDVNYTVTLVVESEFGCADEVQANVFIEGVLIFYVPNAFTPDGDAFNETFKPVFTEGYDAYDYHMTIFNRWGERVFESYDAEYGWDGTYGSGGLTEDGTYIWQIQFGETGTDKKRTQRGHVTVLK